MKTFRSVFTLAALVISSRTAVAAEPTSMGWNIDGVEREALVFAPTAGGPQDKHPLIFVFHGHGGAMMGTARWGFDLEWPQAIVICPQGLATPSGLDPKGKLPGWQRLKGEDNDRDLKFVDAMVSTMRRKYGVDDRRIFAAGFSNGAFFSLLLWVERTDVFAGFTLVAGDLAPGEHLPAANPVLHIAGEADQKVTPYKSRATIAVERRIDEAGGAGQGCGAGCTIYRGKANVKVLWHRGGHEVPPNAARLGVAFFKANGSSRAE